MNQDETCEQIDKELKSWQQGDCHVGSLDLPYLTNPKAHIASQDEIDPDENIRGLVAKHGVCIITQTCDLVRSCKQRPFMILAPLVEVEEADLQEIKKQRRPKYAFVPSFAKERLVVDLDFITTAEKSLILNLKRSNGCTSDFEKRVFAKEVARKMARTAFPDTFVEMIDNLRKRLSQKHNKASPEGEALRALREIRVRAAPSWDSESIEVNILFIREEDQETHGGISWDEHMEGWMKRVNNNPPYDSVVGELATMESLSAKDYHESDPLDLDNLSFSSE